ncbi:hypothetical protein NLI96_g9252 [Meripilus lineatus]|uniref:Uncharacterized protein n=1 Tax=Meripilus lineatus TaxID=2056292 RepID=A0AAD5V0G7_9APHY|nr:hypothetical protein NLI96_g9252 [Physisporinus lineatus]
MTSINSGSKRWTHFHSALQLAIQRSTHKWTFKDFTECFSLWCEEEPESSSSVFNIVAQHMESGMTASPSHRTSLGPVSCALQNKCEELLTQFTVKDNLDRLHAVVTEARARKQTGYTGKDVWKEDLQPRAAVRARTIPLLEQERDRLMAELAELDSNNLDLQAEMQANVEARSVADKESAELLDILEEALRKWGEVPMDEIQSWSLQTAESLSNTNPQ